MTDQQERVLKPAEAKQHLRPGDILLAHQRNSEKRSLLNPVIEIAQGTPFAHSALFLGGNDVAHSTIGRGVVRLSLKQFNKDYDYKIYRPNVSVKERADALAFAAKTIADRKGYDIVSSVVGWLPGHDVGTSIAERRTKDRAADTYSCGGLVAAAYAGIPWAEGKKAVQAIPKDFADAAHTKYVGLVKKAEKKFKLQGHLEHQGIAVAVENRKGSVRKGVDRDGKPWRTVMKMPYGYIKGTKGADGEEVDVYVGPHHDAPSAFVVHQRKSDGKGYDEDKVLLGHHNKKDAIKAYLEHYNSRKFLGPVKEVPVERLKDMIAAGGTLKKIAFPAAMLDELAKLGAISDEQAQRSLERYESLQKASPTTGQVGRYAALGAVAGPAIAAVGQAVRGGRAEGVSRVGHLLGAKKVGDSALRSLAANSATGAVSSGAIPLLRQHMDRHAEMHTLKKYLHENTVDPQAAGAGKLNEPFTPVEKQAFETSQYDGGMSPPSAPQVSQLPPFRKPDLRGVLQKAASMATTPQGRMTASLRVGLPKTTAPSGPSIAQVAKPVGFGRPLAGATKTP